MDRCKLIGYRLKSSKNTSPFQSQNTVALPRKHRVKHAQAAVLQSRMHRITNSFTPAGLTGCGIQPCYVSSLATIHRSSRLPCTLRRRRALKFTETDFIHLEASWKNREVTSFNISEYVRAEHVQAWDLSWAEVASRSITRSANAWWNSSGHWSTRLRMMTKGI